MNHFATHFPPYSRRLAYGLLAFITFLFLLAHPQVMPVGLSWNVTPSLPVGLYWHHHTNGAIQYDDKVCFHYNAPAWAAERDYLPQGVLVCKRVKGMPGDSLIRDGNHLQVCRAVGCESLGEILTTDREGRPAVAAVLPETIPTGYVYLGTTDVPNSFDSRYLGLIAISDIVRTIHPVMVWQ